MEEKEALRETTFQQAQNVERMAEQMQVVLIRACERSTSLNCARHIRSLRQRMVAERNARTGEKRLSRQPV
jgi:hypothetical protein